MPAARTARSLPFRPPNPLEPRVGAVRAFLGALTSISRPSARAVARERRERAPDGGADAAALEAGNRILRTETAELRARLDDAGSHGAAGFLRRLLGR